MNKVTTINLNGNAYQLEEAGYELLQKYLDSAKKKLADDPDKDEILADFERAIAEKCDSHLRPRKNVITEKEIAKIIEEMGPVEPAEGSERKEAKPASKPTSPTKRLYTLSDGAMIGGVANGCAAYLNIDVNIIRLLFVILTFATSGVFIFVYLLMMLALPEARTPEQKAELRGERFSAQDVLDRAKHKYAEVGSKVHWRKVAEQNRPLLSGAGDVLTRLVRLLALVCGIFCALAFGALTAAWISGLWWLAFGHVRFAAQLSTISHWTVALGMMAIYLVGALPFGVLAGTFVSLGANRRFGKQRLHWLAVLASMWIVAIGILIGVVAVTSGRVSDYRASHAYVNIDNHYICINSAACGPETGPWEVQQICSSSYCEWNASGKPLRGNIQTIPQTN